MTFFFMLTHGAGLLHAMLEQSLPMPTADPCKPTSNSEQEACPISSEMASLAFVCTELSPSLWFGF